MLVKFNSIFGCGSDPIRDVITEEVMINPLHVRLLQKASTCSKWTIVIFKDDQSVIVDLEMEEVARKLSGTSLRCRHCDSPPDVRSGRPWCPQCSRYIE